MSLIRNHHSYGIAGKTSLIAAWQRFGSGRVCRGEGKKFRTAWVWIPAREMLSLNCHLAGHCFQLGTEARAPTPGLRDMGDLRLSATGIGVGISGEEASKCPLHGGSSSSRHCRGAAGLGERGAGRELFLSPWCWPEGNGCGKWRWPFPKSPQPVPA